jgi:hypothetical protein
LAAAIVGSGILGLWFTQYWPATQWPVLSRSQVISKSREVAKQFGFDASKANAEIKASVSQPLAYYRQQHPNDASAKSITPLTERVTFEAKSRSAKVGLDSGGMPTYWRAPDEFKSTRSASSEREAGQQAFLFMSGTSAPLFSPPSRSMGEDPKDEEYVWRKRLPEHSDIREKITVLTEGSMVKRAERVLSVADDDVDSETGDHHVYWGVLKGIFWTVCSGGLVVALSIYLLWLMRRSLNHLFVLIAAGAAFVFMLVQQVAAGGDVSAFGTLGSAIAIASLVAVGRAISETARPKWMSLEQLCGLAPLAKATGESVAAGVLCSPLLVAIPFLIAGCGLFPGNSVVAQNLPILYSRVPLLDSLDIANAIYVLGFFGFGIALLWRMIRLRWLRWAIALPIGTVFFANTTRVVTGPLAAPLAAGFFTLALFGFLYKYFDLLAVLTLQLASAVLLGILIIGQKGGNFATLAIALSVCLVAGLWVAQRGRTIAEGDPRATTPPLTGFRGEREKLQAEFSVARRAQQGMLPQSPPTIPGYSIAASCTPSLEVGGDLYDFLALPDGRVGIGVADVSGKGVPAALYMTLTKGLLASVSQDSSDLAKVVEEVNRHLHGVTRKKVFVTMALGFLDAKNRILQCVRAGHNPMVWRQPSKDSTTLVSPPGLGLGITASKVFGNQLTVEEMELAEGDAVVFYSDGITEAMNSSLEQFGEERLMETVAQTDQLDAAATHDIILKAVRDFLGGVHPQDDMTLVVLRVGNERMMVSG